MVSRLRDFYPHRREGEDVILAVNVNEVVETAISMTQPRWKGMALGSGIQIRLDVQLDSNEPVISGNEAELRTVMTNLILNAVDAMSRSGTISIRTRATEQWVIVEVSDTGVGMSHDVQSHALEPFFTTKRDDGSGLGLPMVHGIVERHSGLLPNRE